MAIPTGTVRNAIQSFEDRIASHHYQPYALYINRAARNVLQLSRHTTYVEQLRAAEKATLFNLPDDLLCFLRDHDNLYRAAVRNRAVARRARTSLDLDVVQQVTHRLDNITTTWYLNMIKTSCSESEYRRLMHDPQIWDEIHECTELLHNEIIRQLTHLDEQIPSIGKEIDYENIGPDHVLDNLGHDLTVPTPSRPSDDIDPSHRCCICLEAYTETHAPFITATCNHTLGKPCLARWLNGTARNANLCPHCRTPLCERRARRPTDLLNAPRSEDLAAWAPLIRAVGKMAALETLLEALFGESVAGRFKAHAMERLNYRLFERDLGFCFGLRGRWWLERVDWHGE